MSLRLWLEKRRAALVLRLAARNVAQVCTIVSIDETPTETVVITANDSGSYDERRTRIRALLAARRVYANACEAYQHAAAHE